MEVPQPCFWEIIPQFQRFFIFVFLFTFNHCIFLGYLIHSSRRPCRPRWWSTCVSSKTSLKYMVISNKPRPVFFCFFFKGASKSHAHSKVKISFYPTQAGVTLCAKLREWISNLAKIRQLCRWMKSFPAQLSDSTSKLRQRKGRAGPRHIIT